MVRKAIVLAAGFGTRLKPVTCVTPKPLMPVWGVPILERTIEILRSWGVDDIVCNSHTLHEQISQWAKDYEKCCKEEGESFSLKVSYEPEILGTGGVLNPLRSWIGEENFYLVNGDVVFANAPNPALLEGFDNDPNVIASALVSLEGPRTIEVEPSSRYITEYRSISPGDNGTYTYSGIACLKPRILDFVKKEGFSSIITAFENAMKEGLFVKTSEDTSFLWADAGTIPDYIELNKDGDENAFGSFPQLSAACKEAKIDEKSFVFMSARGSERVFFKCDKGIAILYDDTTRQENALYAGHARFLAKNSIPVPKILADLPAMKTLVMEFAGVERKMSEDDYIKVINLLAQFNKLGSLSEINSINLVTAFGPELWKWERDLFIKHYLSAKLMLQMPNEVLTELENVANTLQNEPVELVHRDFQSTNILWLNDEPRIIDFQGMRLGPAVYDLASLIYDPYVDMSCEMRDKIAECYANAVSRPEVSNVVHIAAVQRLLQCIGAYARLEAAGQPSFKQYIKPALKNLAQAARKASLVETEKFAVHLLEHANGKCSCSSHHHHEG